MGAVYAAWHEFTERTVALKLLHSQVAEGRTHAQRFLQEATASSAIRHPGIAEVLDAGRDRDGSLYVAFELLEGEDLGAAIVGGRARPVRILRMAIEVLDTLQAAHTQGFIHRDIKPANIFLLSRSRDSTSVKLLDFGIARRVRSAAVSSGLSPAGPVVEGLTQAGAVVGTPYYMSPEQMCAEAVDGRADLWALAVVMYYGLAGELPFQARSYVALLTEMLRGGPPPMPVHLSVPAGLEAVLQRALTPRIDDRYPSAAAMQTALQALLPSPGPDETEPATPGSTFTIGRRPPPSPTPPAVGDPASSPSTTAVAPRWRRALEDIEGEITAIEARQPTVMPAPKASGRSSPTPARRRSWFTFKKS